MKRPNSRLRMQPLEDRLTPSITTMVTGEWAAIASVADGGVVLAGRTVDGEALLGRFNSAGTFDPTFGDDGIVLVRGPSKDTRFDAVRIDAQGGILAGGSIANPTTGELDPFLTRYTAQGALDTSFATQGVWTATNGTITDIAIVPQGGFVVTGEMPGTGRHDIGYHRFSAQGQLTASITISQPGDEIAHSIHVQPNGEVLVAGVSDRFLVHRFSANDAIDTSYQASISFGNDDHLLSGLVVQPDGSSIISGSYFNGSEYVVAIVKLTPTGALDTSFDNDGRWTRDLGIGSVSTGLIMGANQSLIVVGYAGGTDGDAAVLIRLSNTGQVSRETLITDASALNTRSFAVTMSEDGSLVAAGAVERAEDGISAFARFYYTGDGNLTSHTIETYSLGDDSTDPPGVTPTPPTLPEVPPADEGSPPVLVLPTHRSTPDPVVTASVVVVPGGPMVPVMPISPPVFEPIIETVPVQVPRKSTHRSDANEARIFAASGNGTPIVRVFDHDGRSLGEFMPFPDATSVRSITADVTGDTIPDVIVATGPGGSAQLQLIDGSTFAVVAELSAFEASFIGGVFLSAADLDGDGTAEIAIAPDQGGGGRVRIFTLIGDELVIYADFFGIEDEGFRGGARVSLGDINGDGVPDLIVAAGFGGGPRIAIYDGRTLGDAVPQKLVPDFFVFEPGLRNGVFTSAGDLNGDGYDDAIFGGGPGGGPRIFALSGRELIAGNEKPVANFFAGEATDRGGVWVSVKNFNDDGHDELLTAVQTEEASEVHVYSGVELPEEGDPSPWQTIDAFQAGLTHVFVG